MRGILLGLPVALLIWALLFWAAWPLIGRPYLDMPLIPPRSAP